MSEHMTIRVNFGRAMPLFPLGTTSLMPHQLLTLRIFEPRYRQMLTDALDGPGQIAMATFDGDRWMQEYHGRPPLRPAVCVGQIVQHAKLPDETYAVVLQGVCRARILSEAPADEEKLYRRAYLEPVGIDMGPEETLLEYRRTLASKLSAGPLNTLKNASGFVEHLQNESVASSAVIELLGLTYLTEDSVRYRLLEMGDAEERAELILREMLELERLVKRALPQKGQSPAKGVSLN